MTADLTPDAVSYDDRGLVPAVVQDATSGEVLMMAYMNAESLARTLDTGQTWFYSRSRGELWNKGATSGHTQVVRGVLVDCDADTLLVLVDQNGAACHTGERTCFFRALAPGENTTFTTLAGLARIVAERAAAADPESSYTARLMAKGVDTICKKVGEEATEVVLATKGREREQVIYESADLLYHLTVLWHHAGVNLQEIMAELASRHRPRGG